MEDDQEDDAYLFPYQNCSTQDSQTATNCTSRWIESEPEEDEDYGLRLNDTNYLPCDLTIDAPEEPGGNLFRFVVLGIGICVVAVLGKQGRCLKWLISFEDDVGSIKLILHRL